jgi:hypothetical protein
MEKTLQNRNEGNQRQPVIKASRMIETAHKAVFARVILLGFFVFAGCERRPNSSHNPTETPWNNLLQTSRATILNGSWQQSESAWGNLQRDDRTGGHLDEWIQLQVDILEQTESDPLKSELRLGAIQQMIFETEASRPYLAWLKKSIDVGLFKEPAVQQKAKELLHDLEPL